MFKTRITEMLGIEYPIICGGMQYVSNAELVAAVSNAGGMGILAVGNFGSKEELRDEIRKIKTLTDKPFGVNVTFMPTLRIIDREGLIDTAIEEGASAIETSGRITEAHVQRIKKGKVKHIHKVARLRDARTAERLGVDAVAIVGFECGGAPPMDEITTFIQVPLVADAVNLPVIAGGGIGDARGFVAALALGADGVVMGTRFMITKESLVHQNVKDAVIRAKETDTVPVLRSLRSMERVFKNEVARKVIEMENRGATLDELVPLISGDKVRASWEKGDINSAILPCGQVIGLINEVPTVKEVIDDMVSGAEDILNRLTRMIRAG
ncbi:MAG: nitronate monooxygenase [Chloroflexi bacterium CG_4_10_14_0_8_um_filter_46_9]|nr:MAG: nitronate monooxygenase [Dehalococcoidia bacterium CG2_30_46_19]PIW40149.1 MAG: nitronate monooxygenase [Chloroflexi bacterium CG15_BIG_FIL_POST_REV_8_21_14_020_46_15]PIZ27312.1 MAG: nitronate monooxygenase [Chloroflexi bacterium CG_4_10_14_0_8_um_filter_46_9]